MWIQVFWGLWCADWQTFADVLEVYSANMFRVKLSHIAHIPLIGIRHW